MRLALALLLAGLAARLLALALARLRLFSVLLSYFDAPDLFSAMAIACLRLFTLPPLPPGPLLSSPCLTAPTYTFTSTGKMVVESKADMKKRGMRSTDLADALRRAGHARRWPICHFPILVSRRARDRQVKRSRPQRDFTNASSIRSTTHGQCWRMIWLVPPTTNKTEP